MDAAERIFHAIHVVQCDPRAELRLYYPSGMVAGAVAAARDGGEFAARGDDAATETLPSIYAAVEWALRRVRAGTISDAKIYSVTRFDEGGFHISLPSTINVWSAERR